MPPPPRVPVDRTPSPSPFAGGRLPGSPPDPSVWSEEQQRQFLNALISGAPIPASSTGLPQFLHPPTGAESLGSGDDPLSALMSQFSQFDNSKGAINASGKAPAAAPQQLRTRIQKLMPLVHLVAVWCLLGYFVLWREPKAFEDQTHGAVLTDRLWTRWAELSWRNTAKEGGLGVQFLVSLAHVNQNLFLNMVLSSHFSGLLQLFKLPFILCVFFQDL
jgi:GET complex subunit GET2